MADSQGLFSLEIVVESLENVVGSCHLPGIAFRLLDYPTLVVHSSGRERLNEHREKCPYQIQSGKSCLFKMNPGILYSRLEATPLYIMLIDISTEKARLFGSTTISLLNCFKNILQSIQRNGVDVPAVHGKKKAFELFNLMGTRVAIVKLSYRLFSFGCTINDHLNCSRAIAQFPYSSRLKTTMEEKTSAENPRYSKSEDFATQSLVDEQEVGKLLPNLHYNVEMQTDICNKEPAMENYYHEDMQTKNSVDNENINITRPPPLYYNSLSKVQYLFTPENSKSVCLKHSPKPLEKKIDFTTTSRKKYQTVSVQTSNLHEVDESNRALNLCADGAPLPDLPFINALLTELSLAKQQMKNNPQPEAYSRNGLQSAVVKSQNRFPMMVVCPKRVPSKHKVKHKVHSQK